LVSITGFLLRLLIKKEKEFVVLKSKFLLIGGFLAVLTNPNYFFVVDFKRTLGFSLTESVVDDVRDELKNIGSGNISATVNHLLKKWIINQRIMSKVLDDPKTRTLFDEVREDFVYDKDSKEEQEAELHNRAEIVKLEKKLKSEGLID
jgi:hypothetical protein